jgi:hypothetical protein
VNRAGPILSAYGASFEPALLHLARMTFDAPRAPARKHRRWRSRPQSPRWTVDAQRRPSRPARLPTRTTPAAATYRCRPGNAPRPGMAPTRTARSRPVGRRQWGPPTSERTEQL